MNNLMDQLAIVPTAKKANVRYKIPPWFRTLFNFGCQLSCLSGNSGTQLYGCLILPESCISSLAIAMGICTTVRQISSVNHPGNFKEGDHALVDGKRAVCTGVINDYGQSLFGFRFREESGKRLNSEPVTYIPDISLPDRVIAVSGREETEWISTRTRSDSFKVSGLEAELFGKDCRNNNSDTDSLQLSLSGVVRHFDDAASEMLFTDKTSNKNCSASIYDMILPRHATPGVVQPLCLITPKGDDTKHSTPVSIWSDPVAADYLEDSESRINIVIRSASHGSTREFCSEFLSIYQGMGFDPVSPDSVSALPQGIPAAFFGNIGEGK